MCRKSVIKTLMNSVYLFHSQHFKSVFLPKNMDMGGAGVRPERRTHIKTLQNVFGTWNCLMESFKDLQDYSLL